MSIDEVKMIIVRRKGFDALWLNRVRQKSNTIITGLLINQQAVIFEVQKNVFYYGVLTIGRQVECL